ncbi:RDD family protein [Nesterenkonia sp. E16_7]|uniref:RDD family protein n=1 Tax=unclassified Nesterenkonia TaxID=2629769 RepID=UPI001A91B9E7|nr:RDD family protein [Nesterenkonia sp. E16_10]MBO0599560.1 RDD family protein [Nesterenkonia sp. E16_7]
MAKNDGAPPNGSAAGAEGPRWAGDQLGLPESGPGSMAPWSRRLLALFIDWGIATVISMAFFGGDELVTLGIFAASHIILIGLLGVTIGKRLMRIQVVRGQNLPGPIFSTVRTLLLMLILPAILIGTDGRGAHDRAAGTVQLRM